MKRIITITILCLASAMAAETAGAQSIQGLLNLFANAKAAKAESYAGDTPTAEQLTASTWVYSSPQVVYAGNSSMATVAIASLRTQLPNMAKAMGLNAGSDTVQFLNDGTAAMQNGENSASIPYAYDAATGTVTFTLVRNDATATFPAVATSSNGTLTVLFDAETTMSTLQQSIPELKDDNSFRMIQAVVDKYPGIKIGASFNAK